MITQQVLERAVARQLLPNAGPVAAPMSALSGAGNGGGIVVSLAPGEGSGRVRGTVKDMSGAVLPGVTIAVATRGLQFPAVSTGDGTFLIVGVPQGIATITAQLEGFSSAAASFVVGDIGHKVTRHDEGGSVEETVTVVARLHRSVKARERWCLRKTRLPKMINLQRRVAGVLPIRIDVPRAGTSYRFSRPLVVDDETRVAFRYRRK